MTEEEQKIEETPVSEEKVEETPVSEEKVEETPVSEEKIEETVISEPVVEQTEVEMSKPIEKEEVSPEVTTEQSEVKRPISPLDSIKLLTHL